MKNILVVSGHPNPSASLANKTILESLRTAFPQAQFRELASLVKDGHFDPVPEQEALLKADVIVLQFPFNWYSVPGLLKARRQAVVQVRLRQPHLGASRRRGRHLYALE